MTAEVAHAPVIEMIDRVRGKVHDRLAAFFDAHPSPVTHPEVAEGYRLLREFVIDGGKRTRPVLCYWGWRGAGGEDGDEGPVISAGAALELYHSGLLIHDDVMDGSGLRRGRPTIHLSAARPGRPAPVGRSAAILLGVLAQAWADELLAVAGADDTRMKVARCLFSRMRTEVISGQYLDLMARVSDASVDQALTVIRFKTAKYSVERPLQIGGALAGARPALLEAYSRFGVPLGEAFQLRDDILGVFGDPAVTGKPDIDDLREGKHTVLSGYAFASAAPGQLAELRAWYGNPEIDHAHAADIRQIMVDTGAVARVEALIDLRVEQALTALAACGIHPMAAEALTLMTDRLTRRVR